MRAIPNLLTGLRLALTVVVFLALIAAAGRLPGAPGAASSTARTILEPLALAAFVIAAVTDFFDGMLARRLGAESLWGAILDPIADKVLVCGAIVGLVALSPDPALALAGGLILFREFTVSALREVCAGRGVRLKVTLLAKWKTTAQLLALVAEIVSSSWSALGLPADLTARGDYGLAADALLWLATLITLITGAQYLASARAALKAS
ncbi:MAG: CDP-diacylglycerol--glycerol-3-phosphate 3-phosphatidyltransferase [Caulobacteraceae bacterium]